MKPGSKAYIRMCKKIYHTNKAILILGILFQFLHWTYPNSPYIGTIGIILITFSAIVMSLFTFLSAFAPVHQEPNWELVYPELALGYVPRDNLNSLIKKSPINEF